MQELGTVYDVSRLLGDAAAIAPQLYLIIWSLGILCVDPLVAAPHKRPWSLSFSLAGLGFALLHLLSVWDLEAPPAAFNDTIILDSFARFFDALFLVGALLTVLVSYRYLDIERAQHSEYYALILLATSGMMFMAGALDLITLFIGLELMSISTYILVGMLRHSRRSNEGALKYFLLGAFSSGVILYGMSLLYGVTGTTYLREIGDALANLPSSGLVVLAIVLMTAGLCFKVAAAPFHMWVPDAYEGAPTAVTAFMSVAVKAAAFSIFFRIYYQAFRDERDLYLLALALIAMLTMTWGNLAAVTQSNVKRLLAYSSISHAGYVLMGLVAGGQFGLQASAVYLLAYTFMNLGIWAILILLRRRDIDGEQMEDFNGLFLRRPGISVLMVIFLLSLAGIPPLGGFIAKYFVFAAVIRTALESTGGIATLLAWLAVVGALNAVVALYYYLRIVKSMFFETESVDVPLSFSTGITVTLVVTAVLTILIGVYPQPFITLAEVASAPLI